MARKADDQRSRIDLVLEAICLPTRVIAPRATLVAKSNYSAGLGTLLAMRVDHVGQLGSLVGFEALRMQPVLDLLGETWYALLHLYLY